MLRPFYQTSETNTTARLDGRNIKLRIEGVDFALEPCRPGYYNLIHEGTNKVLQVIPDDTKTIDIARICIAALKRGIN